MAMDTTLEQNPTAPSRTKTKASVPARRPIQVLPKDIAEKIAAGEVIERPSSVVKELVENALDAGARRITVELENGGLRAVRVIDDGGGIAAEELPLALERHATSKITAVDDLWNLSTLGFRGEALPSIAAISLFTLESRRDGERGRHLSLEGGALKEDKVLPADSAVPRPSGSRMSVEHLFFNVPARLKFLRSKASESSAVRELLERIALSHPAVAFTLLSEGRRTLQLPATALLEERVAAVLDGDVGALEKVEAQFDGARVWGFVDREARAHNSRQIYLAVNGRMVRDKLLQQAVMVALRPVMMEGEYPRAFLSVEVPAGDVDVNVHPTKTEVRFTRPRDIFQLIGVALTPIARETKRVAYEATLSAAPDSTAATIAEPPALDYAASQAPLMDTGRVQYRHKPTPLFESAARAATATEAAPSESPQVWDHATPQAPSSPEAEAPATAPQAAVTPFAGLQYIGQVKNTYLIFQDGDGVVFIDQHAAHERINYERLKTALETEGLKSQPLLLGATVKLKPEEIAFALDSREDIARFGFEIEAFGDRDLIIRAGPAHLNDRQVIPTFTAILRALQENEAQGVPTDPTRLDPKLERAVATAACHGSIRAGQALSPAEALALAGEMERTPSSLNCPHGRPASIKLGWSQLEGLFKR